MGSVGFDGEDESQPSTSNGSKYKLPRMLLDDASVPRKLRSAIRKRGRECITSPLQIPRKPSNGVEMLRKDSSTKKSKPNTKKRARMSKDEEEVAQTLYALAELFSDANNTNQSELDKDPPQTKSSGKQEDSVKITSGITVEPPSDSSAMLDSSSEVVKFHSLNDSQKPELPFSKPSVNPYRLEIELEKASFQDRSMGIESVENYHPLDEKSNVVISLNTLSATGARFDGRYCGSQPNMTEDSPNAKKSTHATVEPKKSWKKCSTHVHICRLIKVLQKSEKKEVPMENYTRLTELQPHVGPAQNTMENYTRLTEIQPHVGPAQNTVKDSAQLQSDNPSHNRGFQDSETSALCSSAKQRYDFLSLGSHEAPKQFHMSYAQSQNHSPILFPASQNSYSSSFHGHTSALATQQLPECLNGSFTQQQQQKWPNQYNNGSPHLAEWRNRGREAPPSMLNYAHARFPHLHYTLGSKYQQMSTQQQQQIMAMNSSLQTLSNVKSNHRRNHHHHHLSLSFERNVNGLYLENIPQLHQHL